MARQRAAISQVHDWNGDGVLSLKVRVGARRGARQEPPVPFEGYNREYVFTDWTPEGFTALDHNRDGRISRDEWHYDRDGFQADHNRDGVLSRTEFLGGDPGEDDDREDSFRNLDVNNDNRVTRDEWHGTRGRFDALTATATVC